MSYTLCVTHNEVTVIYRPTSTLADIFRIAEQHSYYLWKQELYERGNESFDSIFIEMHVFDEHGTEVIGPTFEQLDMACIKDVKLESYPELDQTIQNAVKSQLRRARKPRTTEAVQPYTFG